MLDDVEYLPFAVIAGVTIAVVVVILLCLLAIHRYMILRHYQMKYSQKETKSLEDEDRMWTVRKESWG
jgi:hypothetical protein